jgi:hypothetical protein
MGDLSLLLDRALDDVASRAGVSRLSVVVEPDPESILVTVVGEGDDIEGLPDDSTAPFLDPLTGSTFEWSQTAVACSFRVAGGPI